MLNIRYGSIDNKLLPFKGSRHLYLRKSKKPDKRHYWKIFSPQEKIRNDI